MKTSASKKTKEGSDTLPRPIIPINLGPGDGENILKCAARTGVAPESFVLDLLRQGFAKLEDAALISIPCPFCKLADSLEIIAWNNLRTDGTEYQGDAVRCNRCDAIAPAAKWAMRGERQPSAPLPQ
jgi:hypothetical protein